jgi:hypothetical protein
MVMLYLSEVFGSSATRSFPSTAQLAGVSAEELQSDPKWALRFSVADGKDVEQLPQECPAVGTVILTFEANGRIDRYEVVEFRGVVDCIYAPGKAERYLYSLFPFIRVGQSSVLMRPAGERSSLKPIVRIVLISPAQ